METTTNQSDGDLLSRFVKRDDRDALGELARRHEVHLLGLAKGLLGGNQSLAQEAVQNAWVKVIRYGRSFEGRCSVRTWLFRIVVNQCRSLHARERDGMSTEALRPSLASSQRTEVNELAQRVATAVESLPESQREVLLLCYHAELAHHQAAEVIGIPVGTLKSRLHSALQALRTALSKESVR